MYKQFTLLIDLAEGKEGFALRYIVDGQEATEGFPRFEDGHDAPTFADITACAVGAKEAAEEDQLAKVVNIGISQDAIDKYGKTDPDLRQFLRGGKKPDFIPAENPGDGYLMTPRGLLQLIVGMYRDEPTEPVHKAMDSLIKILLGKGYPRTEGQIRMKLRDASDKEINKWAKHIYDEWTTKEEIMQLLPGATWKKGG